MKKLTKDKVIRDGEMVHITQDPFDEDDEMCEDFINHVIYSYNGEYYTISGEGTEDDWFEYEIYDENKPLIAMTDKELAFYGIIRGDQ